MGGHFWNSRGCRGGTLGFFRDRVINTDGKVNRDAIAYQDHI